MGYGRLLAYPRVCLLDLLYDVFKLKGPRVLDCREGLFEEATSCFVVPFESPETKVDDVGVHACQRPLNMRDGVELLCQEVQFGQ